MGVAMYLFSGGPSQSSLYLAAGLMGAASGATLPMLPIMYSSRFGTKSIGVVLGFVTLMLVVGSFGSLLAGIIYDSTQSYDMAFLIFGALLIPVSIGMAFLPSPKKARESWPEISS
jgi:MFS family permease